MDEQKQLRPVRISALNNTRYLHLVNHLSLRGLVTLHLVVDLDVEITIVAVVGRTRQCALDDVSVRDGQCLWGVEHCLLPVSVLGLWAGAELDGLVASGELDVEPSKEGVDVVVTGSLELEGNLEGEVLLLDGTDVDVLDGTWLRNNSLEVYAVDQWFTESDVLDTRVVKSINVVPDFEVISLNRQLDSQLIFSSLYSWSSMAAR